MLLTPALFRMSACYTAVKMSATFRCVTDDAICAELPADIHVLIAAALDAGPQA
ncbi:MAG: hypothetical protein ABJL99_09375 [Aliishimia sp.]